MMNDDPATSRAAGDLQRRGHDLPAGIENPADILNEALRRLSPEKTQEILDTAASAALRIQIKKKEAELDLLIAGRKLEQTSTAAWQLSSSESFSIQDEIRSENGFTRVTVAKVKPPEPKRGFLSWLLG
jgi:hypothetical protein